MLRQAVYGRLAGYEDVNDADRLRVDPAMRHVVGASSSPACRRRWSNDVESTRRRFGCTTVGRGSYVPSRARRGSARSAAESSGSTERSKAPKTSPRPRKSVSDTMSLRVRCSVGVQASHGNESNGKDRFKEFC
jgi:hypothetical protein